MPTALFRGFSTFNAGPKNNELIDLELVKRDILNQFYTRRGERVMMPNFGSIIWDLMFEPLDETNKETIKNDAITIVTSEPRVEMSDVKIIEFEHGIRLEIEVFYKPYNAYGTLEIEFDRRARESE
jgi:phage baseplate assembly protein W